MRVTGRCHLDFSSAWSLPQPVQRCSSPISPGPRGSISSTKTPQLPTSTCWKPWEGGVALLDYDNDGRLDIFFTNGARIDDPMPDGKLPDKSDPRFWNRLYHQNTEGTFTDVTEKTGLTGMAQHYYTMG